MSAQIRKGSCLSE